MDLSKIGENLFSNLLTIFILLGLGLIVYCKITHKTLGEIFRDIVESIRESKEGAVE